MTNPNPTKVYYNSACPVCDTGIRHHMSRTAGCDIKWVDIHQDGDAAQGLGVAPEAIRERLHVVSEGRTLVGAEAVLALWKITPGYRWLSRLLGLPGLRGILSSIYDRFARALYRWNIRRGHWTVPSQTSGNSDPAELAKFAALADQWWDPESAFRPLHNMNPVRLDWIHAMVNLKQKRVLDVGCGGGILAEAMAEKGAKVTGIDLAEAPLAVARLHAHRTGAILEYVASSAEAMADEQPQSYDVVTCMEMLEHVPRPEEIITACAKLVRPGGWVFFSTINRNPLSWFLAIWGAETVLRLLPKGTHRWDRFIRPEELLSTASRHGLVMRDRRGLGYNPFTGSFRLHGFMGVGYLMAMQSVQAPPSTNLYTSAAVPAQAL